MLKDPLVCQLLGHLNSEHKDTNVFTLCWHTVEVGGPIECYIVNQ